jgi:NPCBM/NEW2 domain-containing protein
MLAARVARVPVRVGAMTDDRSKQWWRNPSWWQVVLAVIAIVVALGAALGIIHATSSSSPTGASDGTAISTPTTPSSSPPFQPVYLDTVPETGGNDVTPGLVSIAGTTYQHGVQMEVGSVITSEEASYSIPSGARSFSTIIGNDDNQPSETWDGISVLFEVFVDGRRVADGHARGKLHDPALNADVSGASTLTLKASNINDGIGGVLLDWANPKFS